MVAPVDPGDQSDGSTHPRRPLFPLGRPLPSMPMLPAGLRVLAHQGGWDELLFVLVPIVLFAGLLALANRRAARAEPEPRGEPGEPR